MNRLFFVYRPKSAFVLSILITLAGLLSINKLSVELYPSKISPPIIEIHASYPGASITTLEQSVIEPLEKELNGIKGMISIESQAVNDGSVLIRILFNDKTDPDMNTVNTQNLVSRASSKLPPALVKNGITISQGNSDHTVLGINLYSPNHTFSAMAMSNYASHYLLDELSRIPNVSKAAITSNKKYSMRIWLNPEKMRALNISVDEINQAIQEQNTLITAGKIGSFPAPQNELFEYTIEAEGRLFSPQQFSHIILKADPDGGNIILNDVARIELGSQEYTNNSFLNNKETVFITITKNSQASALQVAQDVKKKINELIPHFPLDLKATFAFDSTVFIKTSIYEVLKTIVEAIILVILVVFIFLQNFRATLIPALAVPVSLIGTLTIIYLFNISINLITLFAMVLSIGIVVDDAIIVIENVERHLRSGLSPREATIQSMKEIFGPIIATTCVLLSVFIPVTFIPGSSGYLFREFSFILSIAVLISAINALTLSPALCASFLKPGHTQSLPFMRSIDQIIQMITRKYVDCVSIIMNKKTLSLFLFSISLLITFQLIQKLPTGFMQTEDQGFFYIDVQLPNAASLNRTDQVMREITHITLQQKGILDVNTTVGRSLFSGSGSNFGSAIVVLDPWKKRTSKSLSVKAIKKALEGKLQSIPNTIIQLSLPPTLNTGDATNSLSFHLEDIQGHSFAQLESTANHLVQIANQQAELKNIFHTFHANVPMYKLILDREKAKTFGVNLNDVYSTLHTQFGSFYINDFSLNTNIYEVIVQADSPYRSHPSDLSFYYVKNNQGKMIAITNFATLEPILGTAVLNHFNLYRSVAIHAEPAEGYSTSNAIQALKKVTQNIPQGYTYEWSGRALQEFSFHSQIFFIFALAILFIYLVLTALYESWSMPIVILAIIPTALLGSSLAMFLFHITIDIYCQIGILLLVGMVAKSAILMVEFSMNAYREGKSIKDAAIQGAKIRFKPVIMTSCTFIFGVLPLLFSFGAGANTRFNMSLLIISGMLTCSIIGILLTPLLYSLVQNGCEKFLGVHNNKAPKVNN